MIKDKKTIIQILATKYKLPLKEVEQMINYQFKFVEKIMKKGKPIRLRLQLLGNCCVHLEGEDLDEADSSRHKAATAPNLIHSLDGSLLHLSATRFE